jgi:xanthine dehydrogenase/oxidase
VSYSEVEVDVLTGDFTPLHSHLLMDVGAPINPAIDIGQIEGAFAQGLGLFTMEKLVWGDNDHKWVRPGHLLTKGPGNYKIPSVNDIPIKMHVELFKDGKNSRAIYSSKGVGEPPLFMGASVFFAIKAALQAAREEAMGVEEAYNTPFVLHSPATAERIRMAVPDDISKAFMKKGVQPEQVPAFQTKGSF